LVGENPKLIRLEKVAIPRRGGRSGDEVHSFKRLDYVLSSEKVWEKCVF